MVIIYLLTAWNSTRRRSLNGERLQWFGNDKRMTLDGKGFWGNYNEHAFLGLPPQDVVQNQAKLGWLNTIATRQLKTEFTVLVSYYTY